MGSDDPNASTALYLTIDGRLRAGYSRSDASAELRVLAAQQDVVQHGRRTSVIVTDGSMVNRPGNAFAILSIVALVFAALACLSLVACANVVSLLLAVAHTRHVEIALRMALGSSSARLTRMLLTETLALAAVAGVSASFVARRAPEFLIGWITQRPLVYPTQPNWHVFVFLFATTLLAALVVGSAPIRAARAVRSRRLSSRIDQWNERTQSRQQRVDGRANRWRRRAARRGGGGACTMPARIAAAPAHFDARQVLALNILPPDRATGEWTAYHADVARAASRQFRASRSLPSAAPRRWGTSERAVSPSSARKASARFRLFKYPHATSRRSEFTCSAAGR